MKSNKKLQAMVSCLFFLLLFVGCDSSETETLTVDAAAAEGFTLPDPGDFSALSWTEGFTSAHQKLKNEYGFTSWKSIDWDALYDRFFPRIEQAQNTHDEKAYYLALHEYVFSIPDGHVSLTANNTTYLRAVSLDQTGGGYGLSLAELDDGSVIAAVVVPGGPASQAGIQTGAQIITWEGKPILQAIKETNIGTKPYRIFTSEFSPNSESSKATTALYRLEQAKLLARGPVDSQVEVEFINPDASETKKVLLTAILDINPTSNTLTLLNFAKRPDFSDEVEVKLLDEGYGYIRLHAEVDLADFSNYPTAIFQAFQKAIVEFTQAGVPGLIIDLRGNYGGSDELVADLCGFFRETQQVYEYLQIFDKRNNSMPTVGYLAVTPATPYFDKPVVALVNPGTISSGEGLSACIANSPNGKVIGFHGTNGSFGVAGGEVLLPGDYLIKYPYGRSVDEHGNVQLDSRNGVGGVAPGLRIPKNMETVLAHAFSQDVELEYAIGYLANY